jgi:putative hydrolase
MNTVNFDIHKIDLHIHTRFSDGACSIDEAAKVIETKNLGLTAITDHYSEFTLLPRRMTKRRLPHYLDALDGHNLLKGVEVEILEEGTVSISQTTSRLFDVVIGGLHIVHGVRFWGDLTPILNPTKYVEAVRVALIRAMESQLLDVIAHVTRLPETLLPKKTQLITRNWINSVVDAASDQRVAVELSGAWKIPDDDFVVECLKQGVKLSLGSDAHRPQMIGETKYGVEIVKRLKIGSDQIFALGPDKRKSRKKN